MEQKNLCRRWWLVLPLLAGGGLYRLVHIWHLFLGHTHAKVKMQVWNLRTAGKSEQIHKTK